MDGADDKPPAMGDMTPRESGGESEEEPRSGEEEEEAAQAEKKSSAAPDVRRALRVEKSAEAPENVKDFRGPFESQRQKEEEFCDYFGKLVSEWNPCRDDEGQFRYVWDEEVGAHDVEVVCGECSVPAVPQPREPERTRLREVLDDVFALSLIHI